MNFETDAILKNHESVGNTASEMSLNTYEDDLEFFGQESDVDFSEEGYDMESEFVASPCSRGEFAAEADDLTFEAEAAIAEGLPQAWMASYASPKGGITEVIIGRDDRVRVKDTKKYPYRAICQLTITAKNGRRYLGTGWLVNSRTVITAAHNIYLHKAGGWAKSVQVTPGRNDGSRPFGSVSSAAFHTVRGWIQKPDPDYDYAAITIPKKNGLRVGNNYFRVIQASPQIIKGRNLYNSGYAGDKGGRQQWKHHSPATRMTSRRIFYRFDTVGGNSGSPVWITGRSGKAYAVGIHAYGAQSGNSATRFSRPVYRNLKHWMRLGRP